jgi:A/G-specific adenine glycosylase
VARGAGIMRAEPPMPQHANSPIATPVAALALADRVVAWQRQHGRHNLPWQQTRDPYRVWLSEIMLQQTQVATVLGYYERFLQAFPQVAALAEASQDEVLALWSGLGYYSRARNLHRCAQAVVQDHGGQFPGNSEVLASLPGIGRSTAAAIAAFCFGERVAILDGNVKRVLTRALGFDGDLALAAQERQLWNMAQQLLPQVGIEAYTQGLMDLGATVCTLRKPECETCPLAPLCVGLRQGQPQRFPVKTRKLKRGRRENVWLCLMWREQVWLVQRPEQGVWAGLWSLPEFATPEGFEAQAQAWPGDCTAWPSLAHTLTHFDWTLHPRQWRLPDEVAGPQVDAILKDWPTGAWFARDRALAVGLPAPLRKLLTVAWGQAR